MKLLNGDKRNKLPKLPPVIYLGYFYGALFLLFWLFSCAAIPGLFDGGYYFAAFFCMALAVILPYKFAGYFAELFMEHRLANVKCDQVSSLKRSYARMIGVWSRLPVQKGRFFLLSNSNLAVLELCDGDYERGMERFKAVNEKAKKNFFFRNSDLNKLFAFNYAQSLLRLEYYDQCEQFIAKEVKVALPAADASPEATAHVGHVNGNFFNKLLSRRPKQPKNTESWFELRGLILEGTLHVSREDDEQAIAPLEKALAIMKASRASNLIFPVSQLISLMSTHASLALAKLRLDRPAEAISNCDEALAILPQVYQSGFFLQMLSSQVKLAECLMDKGEVDRAASILQYSYAAARLTPYHVDAHDVLLAKERLLIMTGRHSEVADMKIWVLPLEIEEESD